MALMTAMPPDVEPNAPMLCHEITGALMGSLSRLN